jgi:hypothetical protein
MYSLACVSESLQNAFASTALDGGKQCLKRTELNVKRATRWFTRLGAANNAEVAVSNNSCGMRQTMSQQLCQSISSLLFCLSVVGKVLS